MRIHLSGREDWAGLDAILRRTAAAIDGPAELLALWMFTARAGRALRAFGAPTLEAAGLDASDFAIMAALWFRGEPFRATPGAIARDVGLSQSGTARALQRLTQRTAVRKLDDPADGRASFVELTAEGCDAVERLLRSLMTRLAANLDAGPDTGATDTIDVGLLAAGTAGLVDALELAAATAAAAAPASSTPASASGSSARASAPAEAR